MAESKYFGIYQGVVSSIKDPEKRGRVKVKCPEVLGGSTESAWCDPVVPVAFDNGGDFCIPSIGETVWLQFIAGNANKPVYIGGWWQKSMTPLGGNYTDVDTVRIINYADCTIMLQDGKININVSGGSSELTIEEKKITVKGTLLVEGDIECTTGESGGGTIKAKSSIQSESYIEAKSVRGNLIVSNGISLSEHKHDGVTTGSDETGTPIKEG